MFLRLAISHKRKVYCWLALSALLGTYSIHNHIDKTNKHLVMALLPEKVSQIERERFKINVEGFSLDNRQKHLSIIQLRVLFQPSSKFSIFLFTVGVIFFLRI